MPETDKIAILLAAYNGEKYIAEQIESLLYQTQTQWELFIHDDGSTDSTPSILQSYVQRCPARIHVLDGPPCGGAKNNFFYLMRSVRAPYVMFCDQDDVWLPDKIALTMERMRELEAQQGSQAPLLVFTDLRVVDRALETVGERMSVYQKLDPRRTRLKDLMIQNVITGCTVMVNRALLELAVQQEDTDDIIMHDWWCALLAAGFGKISYVDQALVLYRQHESNSVGAKNIGSIGYLRRRLRDHQDIQHSLQAMRTQAAFLARCFSAADPLLSEYGELGGRSKAERFCFYLKNGVRMSGWQRNLGLLICG